MLFSQARPKPLKMIRREWSNGIGEADRRIVQREGAGKNSYRDSDVKALVWPAAYLLGVRRHEFANYYRFSAISNAL